MKFIKKNKKSIILLIIGLLLILSGVLSWKLLFSKYKQFNDQEQLLLNTVKRYYSFNEKYLPKTGETREITYKFLIEKNHIEDLYVPGTNELCDIENSWVRVYKNNENEYKYTVYLKCGRFESKVDHKGPVITLKGDSELILSLGSNYEEPGIEKVVDDKDGNIDIKNVVIDSSSVNTNKLGTYNVTYTIMDKSYNKTVITRKVIVANNLTNVVRNQTDESNYYKGNNPNNYILFSGMLFRIINVNDDGSIKIIAYDNIANTNYSALDKEYSNSNIRKWLNEYYYSNLSNPNNYIIDSNWCLDTTTNIDTNTTECNNTIKDKVGMLTLSDYNKTLSNNSTFLNMKGEYWLITAYDNSKVYISNLFSGINTIEKTSLTGVKPVINLKDNLYITSGNGSFNNPYRIGDYKYANPYDLLNTRLIGEYVVYSGMLFRIAGYDENKNIKLVSTEYLGNTTTGRNIFASYENGIMKYNPTEAGNIGYQLNENYIDYVDTSLVVENNYKLLKYDNNLDYSSYEVVSNYKSKLNIPASFEMFSGSDESSFTQVNYWLRDYVNDNEGFMINSSNGRTFTISEDYYGSNAYKLQFYIKNSIKIKSGNGTLINPYIIQ